MLSLMLNATVNLDQLSGLYPGDPGPPGADSAGTVLSTGSEITHIRSLEC